MPPRPAEAQPGETCQQRFWRNWGHLLDSHVRDLAWLLDSADLLDPAAPQWAGQIATIAKPLPPATLAWLAALDQAPQPLHEYLAIHPFTRLGRYAEQLMAYYLEWQDILRGHGVQVRNDAGGTIGEFDFLVRQGDELVHWEFATKLYLLEPSGDGQAADYFVGPNLADTLGAKMSKVFSRQLKLSHHPAAQRYLPQPVARAQALLKGWLFYHGQKHYAVEASGVNKAHCRGFWCEMAEIDQLDMQYAAILPRLSWLAPVRVRLDAVLDRQTLRAALVEHFAHDSMPILVALLEKNGEEAFEVRRGFIVPDDWRTRAGQRRRPQIS
ncbi:hypothetical protein EDC30_101173 [Paucimonas lemoignei]|uniref:DUF1853 family protein n=1 Tax=Paucimonas lemoignei TaxID=29443 RepID=A0A4R3I348_PAULE|nr:DUF1853 family protein [Paucimonas lemoignei]TCS39221.1 hypothetical protein EDC30_101173 [Paucimonas lemoignei]